MNKKITGLEKAIIGIGKRIYKRGYVASNDGNISARIDKNYILITATGISKGYLTAGHFIVLDMNGSGVHGKKKPSSESQLHLQIYKERPDVQSVCHAHPPFATGFAVAGIPLDQNVLPEVIISLGSIPLIPFGIPGTEEFSKPLLPWLQSYDAFLLANHGAISVGTTVVDAYHKLETLEHFAKILFIAKQLGNVNTLDDMQTGKLVARRKIYGIRENVGQHEKRCE